MRGAFVLEGHLEASEELKERLLKKSNYPTKDLLHQSSLRLWYVELRFGRLGLKDSLLILER
jgi:hypothetical protein